MKIVSLGIDLGTTNSAITYCSNNGGMEYRLINVPNSKNGGILPSCVKYISKDSVVVGQTAYVERWKPSVVYSMKRHMVEGDNYRHKVVAEDGSEFEVSPIDVGAEVLKHMKTFAEDFLGVDGEEVVAKYTITVPAYFNEVARYNTIEAGVRAGIPKENIVLINEPTAAALSYGSRGRKSRERVLVYDLGGGTFDVAILDITRGSDGKPKFTVRTCAGDDNLGGDDLDLQIAEEIITRCVKKLNLELSENGSSIRLSEKAFREDCNLKKRVFSAEICKKEGRTTTVSVPLSEINMNESQKDEIESTLGKNYVIKVNITNKDIKKLSDKVLIEPTTKIIDQLLNESQSLAVNKMILIGGSTKGDELLESLEEYYPDMIINNTSDPDRSVSIGAAIYTEMCSSGEGDRLQDVIQLPIGVLSIDENGKQYVNKVIRQNSRIPATSTKSYRLLTPDQDVITVKVYQGRSTIPDDNIFLGELVVDDLQKYQEEYQNELQKRGEDHEGALLSVEINLSVNVSGILKAVVGINGHIFEGVINRLASGKKSSSSKNDSIKRRQLGTIKSLVPEEELDSVIEQYEEKFKISIKEAASFIKELKDKYNSLSETNFF